MRTPKLIYTASRKHCTDHPVLSGTLQLLKVEVNAVRSNKWLNEQEKTEQINKLRKQLAPQMPEASIQAYITVKL